MPQLGQYSYLLDAVFYLYATRDDALKGCASGGSGFFVTVPSRRWPDRLHHVHGVTNWHVAVQQGFPVIRVNLVSGGTESIDLDCAEWVFRPRWQDIAISPPLSLDSRRHKCEALVAKSFCLTNEEERKQSIDAADDVFMIGRFVDSDGVQTNKPALRFGNISIFNANIGQITGFKGRSIVVDMHSRSGFSGSPVFVFRTPGSLFAGNNTIVTGGHLMKLLGIHWGQFPERWEIKNGKARVAISGDVMEGTESYIQGLSGMTCLCPSSAILDLLFDDKLRRMREECEQKLAPAFAPAPLQPRAESGP